MCIRDSINLIDTPSHDVPDNVPDNDTFTDWSFNEGPGGTGNVGEAGARNVIQNDFEIPAISIETYEEDYEFPVKDEYDGREIHFRINTFFTMPLLYDQYCLDPSTNMIYLGYSLPHPLAQTNELSLIHI